ncbi:MAG: RnfABCDGE type electron transport complex subunit D [Rhodothermales bacterium]
MSADGPQLLLSTSPFLKQREDTAWLMWQVNYSLLPVVLAAVYFFGLSALLVTAACTAGALLPEWLLYRRTPTKTNPLKDGSALITGVLLALTLPPTTPLWMAFTGGVAAIVLGKSIFGGIGYSIFNPALVGRAFLQAAFPLAMTTWAPQGTLRNVVTTHSSNFALPFMKAPVDAVTAATPLARMKFDAEPTALADLLLGTTAGSLGETCALLILLCGVYLGLRKVLNWRIPVSIFATVLLFGALLHWLDASAYPTPTFHLFSGGMVLGAVFMATDPVTSPLTQRGCWLFGLGIGILVIVIRTFGGLPEGMMYAILLMNAATPLINRVTQPRIYGTSKRTSR